MTTALRPQLRPIQAHIKSVATPRDVVVSNAEGSLDVLFWLSSTVSEGAYCLDAPDLIPAGGHKSRQLGSWVWLGQVSTQRDQGATA